MHLCDFRRTICATICVKKSAKNSKFKIFYCGPLYALLRCALPNTVFCRVCFLFMLFFCKVRILENCCLVIVHDGTCALELVLVNS